MPHKYPSAELHIVDKYRKQALCPSPPWKTKHSPTMALKAVHVSDVPCLDQVPENASLGLYSTRFSAGDFLFFFIISFCVSVRLSFLFFFCWLLLLIWFSVSGVDVGRSSFRIPKFLVIGHRGSGMNMLQSSDRRMKAIKENSILSFNTAAEFSVDFVEFDVQVRFPAIPSYSVLFFTSESFPATGKICIHRLGNTSCCRCVVRSPRNLYFVCIHG